MRMNHVPLPQEETLGYYFQSEKCLVTLETQDLLRFLQSVVCKWPVINVTLLTLKNSNKNYKNNGIFPNIINEII